MKWRVGDGRQIEVASHKWLTHAPIFINPPPSPLYVRDLIDEDTRRWDRGKLQTLFAPSTQQEILAVPLDNLTSKDELIWKENVSQKFTVKSAYGVALGLLNKSPFEHSQAQSDGSLWKKIWKLNVPPKVQTLMWRACSNILPTRDNLQ